MPRHQPTIAGRAKYARTNADLLVNDPDGFPSDYPPVSWLAPVGGLNSNGGGAAWWYGSDTGGGAVPIGPNGPWPQGIGPGLAVVTRATQLIIGPLTAAPFRALANGQTGQPAKAPRWVTDPMLLRPDASYPPTPHPAVHQLPRATFWAEWLRCALWYGLGCFISETDSVGQPVPGSMRLIDPRYVATVRADDGTMRWSIDGGEGNAAVFSYDGYLTLGPVTYRLTVLRNPLSPIDVEGNSLGVFALNPGVFSLSGQVDSFTAGSFRSGVPAGYLKVETPGLTGTQAAELKAKWLQAHGGDRRSIAVLNATTSFTPLQFSPVDAALAEVKRLNVADVAFAFNLDPLMFTVTLGNSATYATTQAAFTQHKSYSLSPWIAAVQDTLTAMMPGTAGVAVNLDQFENPPADVRYAAYATAIDSGVLTVNEARFLEGLPALPDDQQAAASLSQQEAVQKVYLGVVNGVITVTEARQMVNDAGGNLDLAVVPTPPAKAIEPAPEPVPEERSKLPWQR